MVRAVSAADLKFLHHWSQINELLPKKAILSRAWFTKG
jgi:hypothetical protein